MKTDDKDYHNGPRLGLADSSESTGTPESEVPRVLVEAKEKSLSSSSPGELDGET